jgi:protocatechuate 3,4-dioxygenase beta subunit
VTRSSSPVSSRRRRAAVFFAVAAVVLVVALARGRRARSPSTPTAHAAAADRRAVAPSPGHARDRAPTVQVGVTGLVLDPAGAPVAGATVGVAGGTSTTDGAGRFAIAGLAPGVYHLHAHAPVGAAGPIRVDLFATSRDLTIRLQPGVAVEVAVVSVVDGRPLAGARGELALTTSVGGGGRLDAVAGDDGVLRFPVAELGNFQVTAEASGHAPATRVLTWNQRAGVVWTSTVALEPGVVVTGQVVDAAGAPVADARVRARPAPRRHTQQAYRPRPPEPLQPAVRTDDDGRFRFAVPTGQALILEASHPAHVVGHSDALTPTADVDVTIALTSGRVVRGRVVDERGQPVAGARVTDGPPLPEADHVAYTDDDGGFSLTGIAARRRQLVLFAEHDGARARPVLVELAELGDAPVELVLELRLGLDGAVVDHRGAPVADAVVTFQRRLPDDYRPAPTGARTVLEAAIHGETRTDGDGRFTVSGLAPGDYQLLARASAAPSGRAAPPLMAQTTVPAGATAVHLALPAPTVIRGQLVANDGAPLLAGEVELAHFGGPVAAGSDGRFELTGIDPGPGAYQLRVRADGAVPREVAVEVRPGEVADLGTIALSRGRTVRGRVVDPDGGAVAGATVSVDEPTGARLATARSDELGRYVAVVPDGPAVVHAAFAGVGGSRFVALVPGVDSVELRLPVTGRLEVEVAVTDGPVVVTATRTDDADGGFRTWVLDRDAATGRYVGAVSPGAYAVRAVRGTTVPRRSTDGVRTIVRGDDVVSVSVAP